MNGAILYPTDDDLMILGIIQDNKLVLELLEQLPEPSSEYLAFILRKIMELTTISIIRAYIEAYNYKPLQINESVLG